MSDDGSDVGCLIRELEGALRCAGCVQVTNESFSSSVCQHTFCGSCVESVLSLSPSQCPTCSVPIWRHNIRFNPIIANIVKQIADLVQQVSDNPTPTKDCQVQLDGDPNVIPEVDHREPLKSPPNDVGLDSEPETVVGDDDGERERVVASLLEHDNLDVSPALIAEPSPSWQPPPTSLTAMQEDHQKLMGSYAEMNLSAILTNFDQTNPDDAKFDTNLSPACFSPTQAEKPKAFVFQTSGLMTQKKDVHDRLLTLGASAANCISDCTHLIVAVDEGNRCQRTLKYVTALLRGIWIISEKWVERSYEEGRWVDESDYEVMGDASVLNVINAPQRSRMCRIPVFAGCVIALDEGSEMPDLAPLICLGDGTVVQPEHHSGDGDVLLICEHELSTRRANQLAKHYGVIPISMAWVFDCCSRLEQIPWQSYRLDL